LRIGLDMLGIQAGNRAVAAYARGLVSALLEPGANHEFVLYGHDEYPRDAFPRAGGATFVPLSFAERPGETRPSGRLERLAAENPDQLDWLVVLDPLGPALAPGPPARPLGSIKLAALVPEAAPLLVPERDLTDPADAERIYRALTRLRHYDAILTPSQTTRGDVMSLLGLEPERACAIGSAADGRQFRPTDPLPIPFESRRALAAVGIRRPFVLADVGLAGQKNVERMVDAYAILPEPLRQSYQLVFVGAATAAAVVYARGASERCGAHPIVFADDVSEALLCPLLQHCIVFVHPALHTGLGSTIAAAMLCGAVVVAGNNSVQAELLGDAGLLVDPGDPGAISAQVRRVLDDWTLRRTLRARVVVWAQQFSFERAAAAAVEALEQRHAKTSPARRLRGDQPHRRALRSRQRRRIAFFSPLPPRISGIADYAARLLDELKATYTIDLYHDAGYLPDLALGPQEFATYDGRLFERNDAVLNYHAIVYQMGNSVAYHGYLYDVLLRHPGVVTLHDFFLSVYPYRGTRNGHEVRAAFRREIRHFCPERADEFLPHVEAWCEEDGGLAAAVARRGLFLNRRVFESALGVAVHSPWCVEQVRAWMPEHLARTVVIPLAVERRDRSAVERAAIRQRFGIPHDALVVSSIGFVHPDKLVTEALAAFRRVAEADPGAWFLCVGEECDGGAARRQALALGVSDRVRFLGRQPAAEYLDLIAVSDIGISLRRPPTNGETSGALLDLLAAGVATLVTDVATFSDYPDSVVAKVRWDERGPQKLEDALLSLAHDRGRRVALGAAAQAHVREHHAWTRSASLYVELIERCAAVRRSGSRQPAAAARRQPASSGKDRS
jgi:glycosyltransferase involved in cell wall biosynthesis